MEIYNCKIKTKTPIHISSGNNYTPSEYVRKRLKGKDKTYNVIDRINFIKYYKELPYKEQERFLSHLSDGKFRLEDYDDKINNKFKRYRCRNKVESEPKDIIEHIKTLDEIYIPGSSIKGAIKTAIFYDRLTINDIENNINTIFFKKYNNKLGIKSSKYKNFINKYFTNQKGKNNIMRFIHITDSSTIKNPTIYEIKTLMAKNKNGMPNGTEYYSNRNKKEIKSYLETIDKTKTLTSEFSIDFNEKILKKSKMNDKIDILNIGYIKNTIYNFSKDLINYELEFAEKYDIDKLTKHYEILSKMNNENQPLLKIGAGSGLMGTSIAMKIKYYNPNIFDNIRKTFNKGYEYEFPKSRKITSNGNLPLSLIQLEFNKKL